MTENRCQVEESGEVRLIREEGETIARYRLREAEFQARLAWRARELMFGPGLGHRERQILFIRSLQHRELARASMREAEAALSELRDDPRARAVDLLRLLTRELDWPPRAGRTH